jgi:hypothetical protein
MRFRPAVLIRAPLRLILGFALACHVLQHVWGYTVLASFATSGVAFLLTSAATLVVAYAWESKDRKKFVDAARGACPGIGPRPSSARAVRSP